MAPVVPSKSRSGSSGKKDRVNVKKPKAVGNAAKKPAVDKKPVKKVASEPEDIDLPRNDDIEDNDSRAIETIPVHGSGDHMVFSDESDSENAMGETLAIGPAVKRKASTAGSSMGSSSKKKPKASIAIYPLNFKSIKPGMSTLCAVKEIHDMELIVCLPFNLNAIIPLTQISPEITKIVEKIAEMEELESSSDIPLLPRLDTIFQVGQILRTTVTEVVESTGHSKKKIELSLYPSLMQKNFQAKDIIAGLPLQVSVLSIEDHGVAVNVGINGLAGFIAGSTIPEDYHCVVGSILNAVVVEAKGRLISLKLCPADSQKALPPSDNLDISHVKAGLIVNSKVSHVAENGLIVKFLDYFEGQVPFSHAVNYARANSGGSFDANNLASFYQIGQKLKTRILYALPAESSIAFEASNAASNVRFGLTLQPHLLSDMPVAFPANLQIGTIIENAVVYHTENTYGAHMIITNTDNMCFDAFTHISRCAEDVINSLEGRKKFMAGTSHKARIIDFGYLDGLIYMSMEKQVLESLFLRYSDIKVGQVIKSATVVRYDAKGSVYFLLCKAANIRAYCPATHFADVPRLTQPEKKFRTGATMDVRILSVDGDKKKVMVTCKPSLVSSKLPILYSLEQTKVELEALADKQLWTVGVISGVKDYGCFVAFYDHLPGFLHVSETSGDSTTDDYTVGQIVKCRVTGIDTKSNRLNVSVKANSTAVQSLTDKTAVEAFEVGTLFDSATVCEISTHSNGLWVMISHDSKTFRGFLPAEQISDRVGACDISKFNVGDALTSLTLIDKQNRKIQNRPVCIPVVSLKKTLARRTGFPSTWESLEIGKIAVGYVKRVDERVGVFVSLGGSVHGLVPRKLVSDDFVKSFSEKFTKGQSIICVIQDVDAKSERVVMSIRNSDLVASIKTQQGAYVDAMAAFASSFSWSAHTQVGKMSEWTVKQEIPGVGYICVQDGLEGIITKSQVEGEVSLNQKIAARILDVDSSNKIADLTMVSKLIDNAKSAKWAKKLVGSQTKANVILVKPAALIVSFASCPSIFAKVAVVTPNNPEDSLAKFSVGDSIEIFACAIDIASPHNNIAVYMPEVALQKSKKLASSLSKAPGAIDADMKEFGDYKVGISTKGLVKSVKAMQANILLSHGDMSANPSIPPVEGRIHISEVVLAPVAGSNVFNIAGIKTGAVVDVNVIGCSHAKTHKWLPLTHTHSTKQIVELSVCRNNSDNASLVAKVGANYIGYVQEIISKSSKYALKISINQINFGRVQIMEVSNEADVIEKFSSHFKLGQAVECIVLSKSESGELELSLRKVGDRFISNLESIKPLDKISCRVTGVNEKGINVVVAASLTSIYGTIPITEISNDFDSISLLSFDKGKFVTAEVIKRLPDENRVILSLRDESQASKDLSIRQLSKLSEASVVRAIITNVGSNGIYVAIGVGITGRVKISEISDDFVKEWNKLFKVGQVVRCKVMAVNEENGLVEVSLKQSEVDPEEYNKIQAEGKMKIGDIAVGQRHTGSVSKVQQRALLIDLDGTRSFRKDLFLRGRCHISEATDDKIEDLSTVYNEGDRVQCIVLSVDKTKNHVALGIKPSYFADESDLSGSDDLDECDSDDDNMILNSDREEVEDAEVHSD
eukprot:Partr_v1_DN29018_c1_g1_i2_m58987 putative programmed cell death